MSEYHGHVTRIDGTHEPLTAEQAEVLMKAFELARMDREKAMPTAKSALRCLIEAEERLHELGWWEGSLRVRGGDECAVAQTGSTGIWRGIVDTERRYVQHGDSVNKPKDVWLKPLSDLTEDERHHMEECDRREAQAYEAMSERYAAMARENDDEA